MTETDDTLTFDDWTEHDDKFALRIVGDSMIQRHIADGDYVVIRKQDHAAKGQIVAVRDDDGEPTLRIYRPTRAGVWLDAANDAVPSVFRERVEILGVLVGVVRKY